MKQNTPYKLGHASLSEKTDDAMSLALLLLLFALLTLIRGAGPECRMQCNDPICHAVCEAACLPPRCIIQCESDKKIDDSRVCFHDRGDGGKALLVNRCPTAPGCAPPTCYTRCPHGTPTDAEVTESCPACETFCDPPVCLSSAGRCSPLCEAPQCGWKCRKPRDDECPPLVCERQCERPACEYSGALRLGAGVLTTLVAISALL